MLPTHSSAERKDCECSLIPWATLLPYEEALSYRGNNCQTVHDEKQGNLWSVWATLQTCLEQVQRTVPLSGTS